MLMILKNTAGQYIPLFAYNSSGPVTGAASTITGYVAIDGGTTPAAFGTANPTEISSTHMPGVYWQPLAQGETNGNALAFAWSSSTAGVSIDPILALTSGVNLPVVAPGAANGLFIAGTNAATSVTTALTTNITGNISGSVGSVTGAVGSVTGAVGSVTGAVGSVTSAVVLPTGTGAGQISLSSGAVLLQPTQTGVTIPTVTTVTNQLTAAQIATAVWTDTTAGDFTTLTSPGKVIFAQLGGAFTTTSSSVFTTAAMVNAPSGTGASAATIATAVWQDLLASSDFSTSSSVGAD